jgi:hypothetical protein
MICVEFGEGDQLNQDDAKVFAPIPLPPSDDETLPEG